MKCSFTTFSGKPCTRLARTETPAGAAWCGVRHNRGNKKRSGGQNGLCSCGSDLKFKKCCGPLPVDAVADITQTTMKASAGLVKATKKTIYSVGYNARRWVIGYERDARVRAHILYLGPVYISRRPR